MKITNADFANSHNNSATKGSKGNLNNMLGFHPNDVSKRYIADYLGFLRQDPTHTKQALQAIQSNNLHGLRSQKSLSIANQLTGTAHVGDPDQLQAVNRFLANSSDQTLQNNNLWSQVSAGVRPQVSGHDIPEVYRGALEISASGLQDNEVQNNQRYQQTTESRQNDANDNPKRAGQALADMNRNQGKPEPQRPKSSPEMPM